MGWFDRVFGVKDDTGTPVSGQSLRDLYKRALNIAWPSTVEGALLSVINSVDTMMVGTLGAAAIASVGLTAQPRMILLILAQALCVGTMAICARRKGANDQAGANSCLMQSLSIVTVLGITMQLIGYFGAGFFMRLAGANEDTFEWSKAYFRIICLGLPLNCWTMCICAALRAIGKTRITMVTNITANLVNVCLNYVLINGKLGFPALGVRGAAIATVCGTAVSALIAVRMICIHNSYYHLSLPRFDGTTLSGLGRVGVSSMAETAFLRIGFLINARLIAGIGTAAFAAYQIVSQVSSLSFTVGDGIASAGTALVGQSLGARRRDQAMATVRVTRKIGIASAIILMLIIFFLRRPLAMLFTQEEQIIHTVSLSFIVVAIGMIPQNGRITYSGCLRGAGDVKFVAICALFSVTVLRPVCTYLLCYPIDALFPGLYIAVMGPWIGFVIDAFVRNWLLYRRIRRGKWLDYKLS